jgi:SAM-dependent methyltransferase
MADDTVEPGARLKDAYRRRFRDTIEYRRRVWEILCEDFFDRLVGPQDTVLDLGCGYGWFVNAVRCGRKIAMDLNPDSAAHLAPGIRSLVADCSRRWPVDSGSLDVVFTSNFFEHLPTKEALTATLLEAHRCLRPDGRLVALGPNIRFLSDVYWDFYDHHIALSDRSVCEAVETSGFAVERVIPRFLPYTMVSSRPPLAFVRTYLRVPFLWRFFGKQFLVVARKIDSAE